MPDTLGSDQALQAGQRLTSPNGRFELLMQDDGNLVLYGNGQAYWDAATFGRPADQRPVRALMQSDAQLVLYDGAGNPQWASGTWAHDADRPYLLIQDDGNLVIYHNGYAPVWASGAPGGGGAIPPQGFVDLIPNTLRIPPTRADLGNGHWMVSDAELVSSGQVTVHTRLTCTNKLAGFTGGVKLVYTDGAGGTLGSSPTEQIGIGQAPLVGAAHRDHTFFDRAPAGTADFALLQFWAPKDRFDAILAGIEDAIGKVAVIIEVAARLCADHPEMCNALASLVFGSSGGGQAPGPNRRVIVP